MVSSMSRRCSALVAPGFCTTVAAFAPGCSSWTADLTMRAVVFRSPAFSTARSQAATACSEVRRSVKTNLAFLVSLVGSNWLMGPAAFGWFFGWIMVCSCFCCGLPAGFRGKQALNMTVQDLDLLLHEAVFSLPADEGEELAE